MVIKILLNRSFFTEAGITLLENDECYTRHGDILSAMREASAFAALSVTQKGTQKSYPEKEEVQALLHS